MRRVLAAVVIAAGVAAVAAGVAWQWMFQPYRGYASAEQFVDLAPGDGTAAIGRKLVDAGVVRDRWAFRAALMRSGVARRLMAGEYRFDRPMTPLEVIARLARGDVYLRPVTFPEGLSIREMSHLFESHGLGPARAFVDAAGDAALVRDLDPSARDLEGYLFPATYSLPRRASATELVRMMVARFRQVFTPEMREAVRASGLSVRQAVTLASIVEKETASPDERPTVAGVYLHRLRIGMPLQCDPTVIYALETAGRYSGNLTHENLSFDSPYNSYRYPGLPPGPIASPGRTSLEAGAHAVPGDYLYFVSRNDGSHVFARTLEEHNHNVFKYQKLFFRQKRLEAERKGRQ